MAAAVLQHQMTVPAAAHCQQFSFAFLSFLKAVLNPHILCNTISLLCYSGKLRICTIVFLERILKVLFWAQVWIHYTALSQIRSRNRLFFLCRESNLCESAEYLQVQKACELGPALNPWQNFHFVM